MICPHCQNDLDVATMSCPRCGAEYPLPGVGLATRARTVLFAVIATTVLVLILSDCVLKQLTIDPSSHDAKNRAFALQYGPLLQAKSPEAQRAILMMMQKEQATQNAPVLTPTQ
jgi:hypothetical protein